MYWCFWFATQGGIVVIIIEELIEKFHDLGVSRNAKIVLWDDKEREYEIKSVDSVFKDEIVIDIVRTKEDYKD